MKALVRKFFDWYFESKFYDKLSWGFTFLFAIYVGVNMDVKNDSGLTSSLWILCYVFFTALITGAHEVYYKHYMKGLNMRRGLYELSFKEQVQEQNLKEAKDYYCSLKTKLMSRIFRMFIKMQLSENGKIDVGLFRTWLSDHLHTCNKFSFSNRAETIEEQIMNNNEWFICENNCLCLKLVFKYRRYDGTLVITNFFVSRETGDVSMEYNIETLVCKDGKKDVDINVIGSRKINGVYRLDINSFDEEVDFFSLIGK